MGRFIDLAGKNFGLLTAIERVESTRSGDTRWFCKCDCGNSKQVRAQELRNGHTKSCGCLTKKRFIDLTGQKFAHWTVLHRAGKDRHGRLLWRCRCVCGIEKNV